MMLFLLEREEKNDFVTLPKIQHLDSVTARKKADCKDKEILEDCRKSVPHARPCHHPFIKKMLLRNNIIFTFILIMMQISYTFKSNF